MRRAGNENAWDSMSSAICVADDSRPVGRRAPARHEARRSSSAGVSTKLLSGGSLLSSIDDALRSLDAAIQAEERDEELQVVSSATSDTPTLNGRWGSSRATTSARRTERGERGREAIALATDERHEVDRQLEVSFTSSPPRRITSETFSQMRLAATPRVVEPSFGENDDVELPSATALENRWLKHAVKKEVAMHRALISIALFAQQNKLFAFRRLQRNSSARRAVLCQEVLPAATSPRVAEQRRLLAARRMAKVLKGARLARFGIAWRCLVERFEYARSRNAIMLSLSSNTARLTLCEELRAVLPHLLRGVDANSEIWQSYLVVGKDDRHNTSDSLRLSSRHPKEERRLKSPLELFAPR